MASTTYSAEFKSKIVLDLLQGDKQLGEFAAENNLNPNQIRNWKKEFLENSSRVFDENKREKEMRRKEQELEARRAELYKTIGQLTIERDWLRQCGKMLGGPDFEENYRRKNGGFER